MRKFPFARSLSLSPSPRELDPEPLRPYPAFIPNLIENFPVLFLPSIEPLIENFPALSVPSIESLIENIPVLSVPSIESLIENIPVLSVPSSSP
jgi:hypothetical protein